MKKDAFDDVICPFNYRAELEKARAALEANVGQYISQNPATGYRELAKQFHMSPAALYAIAKKYSSKRKPGPRSLGTKATFFVRHTIKEKELETTVTVKARKGISVEEMRSSIANYFNTDDVSVSRGRETERGFKCDYDEIQASNTPIQYMRKGASEIETDLQTLDGCNQQALASDSGEIGFKSVTRWLAAHRPRRDGMYSRAKRMAARYAELRER